MKRRALLIGVGDVLGDASKLPGTYADLATLRAHFVQIEGGAWDESEILSLKDPTRRQVVDAKNFLHSADFAFVAFSGHGCERATQPVPGYNVCMTHMLCRDRQEVTRAELTPATGRSIVLLDCCRVFQPLQEKIAKSIESITLTQRLRIDRATARRQFDTAVQDAPLGPSIVYGCEFNSLASDNPSFTGSLVAASRAWAEGANGVGVLGLAFAFDLGRRLHNSISPGHNPTMATNRSHKQLPFSVGHYYPR